MSQTLAIKPLGTVLQQADLVSDTQIKIALREQTRSKNRRIGEILALQGWIEQKTADFFAERLPTLLNQKSQQPLGQYLKEAALLNEEQISVILAEQKQTGLRFGELAVQKGWLKSTTIDFFLNFLNRDRSFKKEQNLSHSSELISTIRQRLLENIHCEPLQLLRLYRQILRHREILAHDTPEQAELLEMGLIVNEQGKLRVADRIYQSIFSRSWVEQELARLQPFSQIRLKLFKLEEKASYPYSVLEEILDWTGEQFYLTQKLCQLIAESDVFIKAGEEVARVEQLVQKHLLENWQHQSVGEHLRKIQQRLLENRRCEPLLLLQVYREILRHTEVLSDSTPEQFELLEIGLVKEQQSRLSVANRIYQEVFNLSWVEQQLLSIQSHRFGLEALSFQQKASHSYRVLEEILDWTGEQVYLTQKLCQLIAESDVFIEADEEAIRVEQLISKYAIANWKNQILGKHLKEIQQQLLENRHREPLPLLQVYREILRHPEVLSNSTPEQVELLEIGLVKEQQSRLSVANRIYQEVFSLPWVEQQLLSIQSHRFGLEALSFQQKASHPYRVLEEILNWTGAQPDLTQKLCQLIAKSDVFLEAGEEAIRVEQLVQKQLLENWQHQIAGEHLREIQQRLLDNRHSEPLQLLRSYHQILHHEEIIADGTPEQTELLKIGLVKERQGRLRVANRIYEAVFNLSWVEQAITQGLSSSIAATNTTQEAAVTSPLAPAIRTSEKPKTKNRTLKRTLLFGAIAGATLAGFYLLFPRQEPIVFRQGNELLNQGKYQQAIAKYDEVLASDANYYQAWTNRGYALAGLRQYDKMLDSCTSATIVEPKAIYAWNCQGEAFHNLKQYEKASAAFDKAIAVDPSDPVFWINKSESLLSLKRPQEALTTSDRAIEILEAIEQTDGTNPVTREFSIALTSKGRALSEKQEYVEALEAYNRALKYSPNYFPAQRGKGMVLQYLGRYEEAISTFEEIINNPNQSDRQKAEALYYKGLTLCDSQQPQAAYSAFEEALKLKPNYQEAENAKITCNARR